MNATDERISVSILEEWRNHLNNAINQREFNLADIDIVDLSGRVDSMVFNEMQGMEPDEEFAV